jgi:hypothetical protein
MVFPSNLVISIEGCSTQPPSYESPSPTPLAFPPHYISLDSKMSTSVSCITSPGLAGHIFSWSARSSCGNPRLLAILVGDRAIYCCTWTFMQLWSGKLIVPEPLAAALALLLRISMNNGVVSQGLSAGPLYGGHGIIHLPLTFCHFSILKSPKQTLVTEHLNW